METGLTYTLIDEHLRDRTLARFDVIHALQSGLLRDCPSAVQTKTDCMSHCLPPYQVDHPPLWASMSLCHHLNLHCLHYLLLLMAH